MDHPFKTPAQIETQKYALTLAKMPVLSQQNPAIEEAALLAFISDVAMGVVELDVIAARYGVTLLEAVAITKLPTVAKRIQTKRALWESEDNVTERNRVLYGLLALDAAAVLDKQILHNPSVPASVLLDGLKVAARIGGLDFQPRQGPDAATTTAPVNIQIVFSGGNVEEIRTRPGPVIEGEAA